MTDSCIKFYGFKVAGPISNWSSSCIGQSNINLLFHFNYLVQYGIYFIELNIDYADQAHFSNDIIKKFLSK